MVWVALDAAQRARRHYGLFASYEWEKFAAVAGIRLVVESLPEWLPALRFEQTIILRRQLCYQSMTWWFWHECGHIMLHPGNVLSNTHCILISKQERQADEFAATFPVWDEQPYITLGA